MPLRCVRLFIVEQIVHRRYCIVASFLIGTSVAIAQNLYTSFGPLSEIPVGGVVSGIFGNAQSSKDEFDFGLYGPQQISLVFSQNPSEVFTKTLRFNERLEKVFTADCNRDNKTDLIIVTFQPTALSIHLARGDTFSLEWSTELSFIPEEITVGDLNSDRKPDILLYGKKNLGVYVLLGYGNGTFKPAQPVLEEFSFSHLWVHDFNKDRVMDILGYDWVRNELLIFSAISPLHFTVPATFALASELVDVAVAFIDNDQNIDLVVLYKEPEQLRVFRGDGLGNFSDLTQIPLLYVPSKLFVTDVNDDHREDIIIFSQSERSFHTYMNDEGSLSTFDISYATTLNPADIAVSYSPAKGTSKSGILDKQRKSFFIYHYYLHSYLSSREQTYAVGLSPRSLTVFDANRNGLPDLIVTNAGSQHLSLYLNRGDGTFYGQIPLINERDASSISSFWKDESTFVCITTHPAINKIAFTEVHYPNFDSKVFSFPAPPNVEVVFHQYDATGRSLRIIVASHELQQYSMTELFWRRLGNRPDMQMNEDDIVENTIFQTPPGSVVALEYCDLNKDGFGDVLYLQREESSKRFSLFVSFGVTNDTIRHQGKRRFQQSKALVNVPDTNLQSAHVWCMDLNEDDILDLVLYYRSMNSNLVVSLGANDGSYLPWQDVSSQVDIRSKQDLVLADVNNDGIKDLLVSNAHSKAIQVYSGKGGGKFSKPKRLLSFPSGGTFAVFDGNGDKIPDYAVLHSEPGVLKVFLGGE